MEHKIFHKIRRFKIPFIIRFFIMFLLIIIWLSLVVLPIPGSAAIWWIIVIFWIIFIIKAEKINALQKLRKWIFYFLKNIHNKEIIKYKIKDFKKHIKEIINHKNKYKK